jgi:hypothetical protein
VEVTLVLMSTYELTLGDKMLGLVTWTHTDQPWFHGTFEPYPDYSDVRPMFEQELSLLDQAGVEWTKLWVDIEEMGLRLVAVGTGEEVRNPLLHIDGQQVWWRD